MLTISNFSKGQLSASLFIFFMSPATLLTLPTRPVTITGKYCKFHGILNKPAENIFVNKIKMCPILE